MENIVDCEVISGGRIGERVYIPQDQSYFDWKYSTIQV
jgi:hypothetical protein